MRELDLFETGCFCILLLLSLVLPLAMSFWGPRTGDAKRTCMKTVWTGQILSALAGLTLLLLPHSAVYATAFAMLSCSSCAVVLQKQFRGAVVVQ